MSERPTGIPIPLEPLVARVLAPNPSPFTFTGTQTHLVGERELAVIDPGPDDPAHLAALVAAIGGRRVAAILVTHHHRDHSPASRPLAALTGAPIVGAARVAVAGDDGAADAAFDAAYRPDRVLGDGEAVAGDGWTLTVVATPGHSSNHLAFSLAEAQGGAGALLSGDHVMGWSTSVVSPPDGDMGAYIASLDKLLDRTERVYYPGHGEAVTDPRRLVRGMLAHRKQREGQILRLLAAEGGQALTAMTARLYVGLAPALRVAAERTVLAHLIHLGARGLVAEAEGRWWREPVPA